MGAPRAALGRAVPPRLRPLKLGSATLPGHAFLAPMAGVTDLGMRRAALRFGASLAVSEMVAGDQLAQGSADSLIRALGDGRHPHVVQIAGCRGADLAEAARIAEGAGAAAVDINMGCPAKRVTGGLAGSALMRDLDHAARLIAATVGAVSVPVTLKMRLGWDEGSMNAATLAARAETEGVALVTVHGRTRCQFYKGRANWAAVRAVKRSVAIPVVVNGDCGSPDDAAAMLRASGADAVMVGRAALGRPWLVGQIASFLANGTRPAEPSLEARGEAALDHYETLLGLFGVARGVRHARKHLVAYADDVARQFRRAGSLRGALAASDDHREVTALLRRLFDPRFLEDAAT